MARSRLELQTTLEELLGSRNVYYQPPANTQMSYPAIRYERDSSWDIFADNRKYVVHKAYTVTLIGLDPDSPLVDKLELLPMCSYVRYYAADGLNHDVFRIYL